MADIIDVIVKASNGTTNVTYSALQGATATDPAVWQDIASSAVFGNRDKLICKSRDNGTKTARWVEFEGTFPVRRTENAIEVVKGVIPIKFSVACPNWATDTEIGEAVDRYINSLSGVHMRASIKRRYAPS